MDGDVEEAARASALPADSGARSRLQELLEEAARILGFGAFPGTMEVVLDRGPTLVDVYRKDRLKPADLHRYDAPAEASS
jgi:hypothetical protein